VTSTAGQVGQPSSADRLERSVADRITLAVLGTMRVGTLALGARSAGDDAIVHPAIDAAALAVVTLESLLVFGIGWRRARAGREPALTPATAAAEALVALGALFAVAYATRYDHRATSAFWMEEYAVITGAILGAVARPAWLGAVLTSVLAVAYALAVLAWPPGRGAVSGASSATVAANALSFMPFWAVAWIGFSTLRALVAQRVRLRAQLRQVVDRQARVSAASEAFRVGHDIPKALLRVVRRGRIPAVELRPLAARFRDDLRAATSGREPVRIGLADALARLADGFADWNDLRTDLSGVGELPDGAPAVLITGAARELLNNASFHAPDHPITLRASSSAARIEISVHNDGPGVLPDRLRASFTRKRGTLHQLEEHGGSYAIASSPAADAGTTVTLSWPAAEGGAPVVGRVGA
jgi:hypothetical protein